MHIGSGHVVELPAAELARRREATSKEWPIANAWFPGYGRDELMSTHKSNHITICYGDILQELGATSAKLGIKTHVAGDARLQFKAQ